MANAIHVIVPHRHASTWVFDDPRVGLSQEPFVSGIPEMIDTMVANIPNAEKGFRLLFASKPFPGYQVKLEKIRENKRGRESLLTASSARAFSSLPSLLSRSVALRSLKGYRFGEDLLIAHAREIGYSYSRPAGSATD